ncbi:GntR family transcriptional regulator [Ancylobacter mangrovi]|uniref:GntR family transcriptional regulator n=1 Tax=Ancylobacter mangrovi TaxID=2972472 RepID=UPI00216375FF|nr:GntR family transcriptional regulator [Ancylobacter mangrovi]MCS0502133.1 GntR family transcriptional regulator [Ancylobacter mangrovi]
MLETLRRAISEGELAPGQRLDPASIALQLRCSRMPVRDAIKELEAEGLVVSYPSRGTEVSRLERSDIEQIFGIRLALEKVALERAVFRMGEEDHGALHDLLLRMDEPSDLKSWLALNEAFHSHIAQASGWPRLVTQIERERRNIDRYVRVRVRVDGHEQPQREHWELYQACVERDAARACSILERHLNRTAQLLSDEGVSP